MATITASPNPVGVYSANVGALTRIEWDTQLLSGANAGKVFVSVNGASEDPVPGQSAGRTGNFDHTVKTPNSYTFILRRADNNAELARVTVMTYDLRNELIAGFAAPYVPALRPQMISNVSVKPGVDTVRITFNTVRPTIPLTTLMDSSGAKIDARFPLFGGLQTSHTAVFGLERPLELEAKHSFRIVAAGPTGNKNSPKEAIFDGEFITGKRKIDIFFDEVDVHDDGDPWPSGSGDFRFQFGAGDAETAAPMGEPWPEYGPDDISYDDPAVSLNKQISIPRGPRQLWLAVVAVENDRTLWPWDWSSAHRGTRPTFTGAGSNYIASAAWEHAWVTSVFDIGSEPGAWTMAFDMATGDFPVDYVVSGHIAAELEVGAAIAPKMLKWGGPLKFTTVLGEAGTVAHIAARGAGQNAEALVIAADGALHHRSISPESKRGDDSDWTRIDLPGEGTVSVAASAPNMLDLVVRHSDGSVSHRSHDSQRPKNGKWRKLGGNFSHVVPAVEATKGKEPAVLLFGVEEDGSLHVRDARGGVDWDRLSDQVVSAIAPVSIEGAAASLFAVGADGMLLHCSKQRGRWSSQPVAPAPGRAPTQLLTTAVFDRADGKGRGRTRDVVVGALGEDHTVRVLRWPNYPSGTPESRWEELGPLQELLVADPMPARTKSKESPRPRSTKRSAAQR